MVRDADGGRVFSAARSEASEGFVCLISPGRPVERRPGQVRAAAPPSVAAAGTAGADNGGDKRFDLSPRARMQPLLAVVSVGGQKNNSVFDRVDGSYAWVNICFSFH